MRERVRGNSPTIRERSLAAMAIIALACFGAMAGVILALYFVPYPELLFGRANAPANFDARLEVEMAGERFTIPEPYVESVERRMFGGVQRIVLRFPWPFAENTKPPRDGALELNDTIRVVIAPRSERLSPAERLDRVYPLYFEGRPTPFENGLTRHDFAAGSPYAGEAVYVGTMEHGKVVIRCAAAAAERGPDGCERQIPLGDGLVARYRFHRDHLPDWRAIEKLAITLPAEFRHAPKGDQRLD